MTSVPGPTSESAEAAVIASHKFTNFDYVRLVAAASVIFSHSFTIAEDSEKNEPLARLLGTDNITAIYGVCVFFIVSGFLITMSAVNSRSVIQYAASRILRIYPAFLMCQLLTALILGAMFSSIGPAAYVKSLYALKYTYHHVFDIANAWEIPTVRFYVDARRTGEGLNGSLWTIQQELFCYLVIGCLLLGRVLNWRIVLLVLALSSPYAVPWNRNNADTLMTLIDYRIDEDRVYDYLWVGQSFFIGSLIYFFWRRRKDLPAWPLWGCAAVLGWAIYRQHYYDLFPFYAAYPILYFATRRRGLPSLHKFGDISYGLYLYGWPVEQTVRGLWGPGVAWWQVFIVSLLGASTAGYLSWHLLEKHALALKRYFRPEYMAAGWRHGRAMIGKGQ